MGCCLGGNKHAVRVLEKLAQGGAMFLRLKDGVKGVDVRDAVCCCEWAIKDDMVLCVTFWVVWV